MDIFISYASEQHSAAEEKWPSPAGRVLPVMAQPAPKALVRAYLRAVSILRLSN